VPKRPLTSRGKRSPAGVDEADLEVITRAVSSHEKGPANATDPRGRYGKKKRKPGAPAFDDLVKRNFTAAQPNTLWLVDITEHWTGEGKLSLGAIGDFISNKIVGYSIDSRMKAASLSTH
jgi:transposase InsO family protein